MTENQHASEVLETCISLVFSGKESVDSALAKFPAYADTLRPELEAALWLRKQRGSVIAPTNFVFSSRQRLVQQIKDGKSSPISRQQGLFGWLPALGIATVAAVFLFIFGFVFYNGSQVVQASLPGDPTYRLKLAFEDVRLSFASSAADSAELRIEFANERVREMDALVAQARYDDVEAALSDYQEQLSIARDLITSISDDPARKAELAQNLATTISLNNQTFTDMMVMAVGLPADLADLFVDMVALNEETIAVMVLVLDELGEQWTPLLTVTVLPTVTETVVSSSTSTPQPVDLMVPTSTQKPPTITVAPTSVPNESLHPRVPPTLTATPKPPDQTNPGDEGRLKPTRKPTKTPKPTKTAKSND